ncbi:MAG TPA: tripartite tricarboxylate transporter substrate binding protein [Burkholderiales bacterium]|nr:tripartite tricarboxylate transporter substrate binding protein [Burkholderiales bacterium]
MRETFFISFLACFTFAQAQTYPSKPIRLIVPFAPGGSSEFVARTVSAEMAKSLGQNFVIENKPGGGGNIAMGEVARAEPDGYTLIIGHIGTLAANPAMSRELPYDANKDFTPISLLVKVVTLYVVHADVPVKDLKELIALAKREPGKLNYGSAGNASAGHLAMEYLKLATGGIDIQHVPYKGTGPMVIDLVAGRTQVGVAGTPPLLQHVKAGKLRAVAVGTPGRLAVLPDVRSVAEQGYPGFETSQWYGLIGPAKMPDSVIKKLSEEAARAVRSKVVLDRLATESAIPVGSTPDEFAQFVAKEQAHWKEVVQKAHIKAD